MVAIYCWQLICHVARAIGTSLVWSQYAIVNGKVQIDLWLLVQISLSWKWYVPIAFLRPFSGINDRMAIENMEDEILR